MVNDPFILMGYYRYIYWILGAHIYYTYEINKSLKCQLKGKKC